MDIKFVVRVKNASITGSKYFSVNQKLPPQPMIQESASEQTTSGSNRVQAGVLKLYTTTFLESASPLSN